MLTGLNARPLRKGGALQESGLPGPRIVTVTTRMVLTPGTRWLELFLFAPGGGGGGAPITGAAAQAAGGGGGAGGYGRLYLPVRFSYIDIVIGAPGVGVFGANGTSGGDCSAAGMIVNGGTGGGVGVTRTAANYSGAPGGGGAGTGANLGSPGQAGAPGTVFAGGAISGTGGSGPWGAGGPCIIADGTIAGSGNPGLGYGSGGGGAVAVNSGSAPKGGDGAPGVCYVWEGR